MRFREFLKEFFRSLKKGRLHRALKFVLVVLFLFFSYRISAEIFTYWLKEKEKLSLVKRNFHVGFDWRRGELSLRADYFSVENPEFSCEFFRPEVDLSLYRSLRELRPVISFVGFSDGRVAVEKRKKGKGSSLSLPFLIESAEIGRLSLLWGENSVVVNRFLYRGKELFFGGLNGTINGRKVFVGPFSGYRVGGYFLVPAFSAGYDGWKTFGELKFFGLERWEFSGSVFSSLFSGMLNVKNYGKLWVSWKGRAKGINTEGKGVLKVGRGEVRFEEVKGRFDGGRFSFRGRAGEKLEIEGRVTSKRFSYRGIRAEGAEVRFSVTGTLKEPEVVLKGHVDRLKTPAAVLNSLEIKGLADRENGKFSWKSGKVKGRVFFVWKERRGEGVISLNRFRLKDVPATEKFRKKYGMWIPELSLSGSVKFKAEGKRISYKGNLKVNRLKFQGFEAAGNLKIRGDSEKVSVSGNLKGKEGGEVQGEADIYVKERRIGSSFSAVSLPVEKFRFLRKVGLAGSVSGRGRVWGELKNPQALFSVSSNSFSFEGVNLGRGEGEVDLKEGVLSVRAVTERGRLDLLKLRLKGKRELLAKGSVENVSGKEVKKVLTGLKVKLPFEFKGTGSGRFSVYSEDLKKKGSLQVKVGIERFSGEFVYKDLRVRGNAEGTVEYNRGNVSVDLKGDVEETSYKGKVLRGGKYRVSLKNRELSISVEGARYVGVKGLKNEISGRVSIDLKEGRIKGEGRVKADYSLEKRAGVDGDVVYSVSGGLAKFTVKISGKLNFRSEITGERKFRIEGAVLEPDNLGTITVSGNGTDLKLIANGSYWQAVGVVRKVVLRSEKAKVRINMAFVNLNVTELTGTVAVPAFKVYPKGFYPLYSVSGLYVTLKEGKPEISDVTLSYVDGWIKVKGLSVKEDGKAISGKVEANIGAKGLVYLAGAQNSVPYVRNSFRVEGSFRYGRELHYRATIDGTGVEFRTRYLLDKAIVNSLKAVVEDNRLKEVKGNITAGSGSALIEGKGEEIEVTTSLIPVGEVGSWKGLLSGKLTYGKEGVEGTLTVSKAKVFMGKGAEKRKESKTGQSKLPVKVNVNLLFDQPLKIKGELFSLTLVPKLWIRTVNGRAVVGGTFYVTDGKIDYMGKEFKVIYGTGTITDLQRKKGKVSILASAYVSGYYVYMKIEGSFNNLTIYLSSDPPLTREQILNLIMTGASPEEIEASSELFPAVQVAYYATASLFKPFEAKFQKTLRLESFSIEPYITKYGETVAKLTIAKRLAKRIRLVGYGTTGQNPEYGGSVQLFLKKNYYLELRYNSYYGPEAGIGLEVNRR